MWFSFWLRNGKRFHSAERQRRRGWPRHRAAFRPRLETLEDRCVPSTLTVTNPGDDVNVKGTLRYDIAHAASGDTILITPALHGAPIVLTHGELLLTQDLTIKGLPNNPETISGGGNSRVFEVAANAHVSLIDLNITGGNGLANNPNGTSSLDGSGGGILNLGPLTVSNCTFTGNQCQQGGGAIEDYGPTLTITNSSFVGNTAGYGGGIDRRIRPGLSASPAPPS